MAMQINKVLYLVALEDKIVDHLLNGCDDGIHELIGALCPLSIDVGTSNIAARVTIYYSVDVYHWNYLEYVLL